MSLWYWGIIGFTVGVLFASVFYVILYISHNYKHDAEYKRVKEELE